MPTTNKTLIFFTDSFPFGTSETFIENEFPFLLRSFERIFIVTANLIDEKTRLIPNNIEIIRIPFAPSFKYKVISLLNFFNPVIQREIGLIKDEFLLRADKKILSVLLASYAKALEVNDMLENLVSKYGIEKNGLFLYSYWMNDITAGSALFRKNNPQVRSFCRVHRWDVYFETQSPPYLPLRNFMIENLDMVFCISNDAFDYLQRLTSKRLSCHLTISRLGTFNTDKIKAQPNDGMLRIISCSNIIPLKRVHLIIEALSLIDDIQIEWIHFGKGPLTDKLKKLATEKLGGKPNIKHSFAGQISNTDLLTFYKNNKVDLFINVSETEGIPVSIIEAGSFGIAVIGTRVGGVGEILEEGKNGFLLKQTCLASEVADAVVRFYRLSEEEKRKIRENAVSIWNQKYSAEKNYTAFIGEILSLG